MIAEPTRDATRPYGLPNIDGVLVLIENVDAKLSWGFWCSQGVLRAGLHFGNKLVSKSTIDIKDKLVSIAHDARIAFLTSTPKTSATDA